jgi:hypothetical protein
VPSAQVHIVDAGHFALDTALDEIAARVREFMDMPKESVQGEEIMATAMTPAPADRVIHKAFGRGSEVENENFIGAAADFAAIVDPGALAPIAIITALRRHEME